MAKYKVWLTVKDRYGSLKEIDAGGINVELSSFDKDEIAVLDANFATESEVAGAIHENADKIRYSSFELKED